MNILYSLWDILPKNVIDLIFAFDSTFYNLMNQQVLKIRPLGMHADQSAQFYASIMSRRFPNSHYGDLLQIMNLKSIYTGYPKFPLKHELIKKVDYPMRLHGVDLHKLVFSYENKIHWYICVNSKSCVLKKILFNRFVHMTASTRIHIYTKIANIHPIVSFTKITECLKYPTVEKLSLVSFCLLLQHQTVEIENIHIMMMQDKIIIEYLPTENSESHFFTNKCNKYNALVYYLHKVLNNVSNIY